MKLNIIDSTENYTHDMSISENKHKETISNAKSPMEHLSQMGYNSGTSTLPKNACCKHSATNTTSDVSHGPSNCLSFPMELVISPTTWKGLTENLNCYYEDDCLCKNRKWPYLHMDTISKLRLKSLVKSIYDDKRNSNLFKPPSCQFEEEATLSTCFLKPRRKRKKCKKRKGCCCKRSPSVVSLHLNWPKCGGSGKGSCCCKKKKKRRARSPVRAACPYIAANSVQDTCPPTKTGTKAISLTLGNQKIVISLEDSAGVGCSVNKDLPCLVKSTQAVEEKCCRPRSRNRSITYKTRSSSSTRRPQRSTPKTCECLDKLKTKIAENLIRLISNKVANCNDSCKSRRTQSKVDSGTWTSSKVSNSTFEIDLDVEESRSCCRESQPRSRSRQEKSNPCCGCRKKKRSRQNLCPPSWSDNHSKYKNVVISVNSGQQDKIGSCCCKKCANEKKRYSSAGPPVEYVYLQEERTSNRAAVDSGSSSMNSQNYDLQYDNNSSESTSNREDSNQFRSKQGVFLQNEMAIAPQSTIIRGNACDKHSHNYKERNDQAVPLSRMVRNDFIPFDTKSEGTTISQASDLILGKSVTHLSCNKENFKVSNDDEKYNCSTSKLISNIQKNNEAVGNIQQNEKEFDFNRKEKQTNNSTKYRYKYTPRIARYNENSDDAVNDLLFTMRDQKVKQNCSENTCAKNYYLEDSKCDELNKLLLEIQTYWQMNSSNSNIFGEQGKFFNERGEEVDDGFVESINDDLDDPDFWQNL